MSSIPVKLTQSQFDRYVLPHLAIAKRGFVSKIPLYKIFNYILYFLHTGCQWEQLPMAPDADEPEKPELSWNAVNHHFRKWSKTAVWNGCGRIALPCSNRKRPWT